MAKTKRLFILREVIDMAVVKSLRNKLIAQDVKRWGRNTLIFTSPALIVFLMALQAGVPVKEALFAMYPAFINLLIDLLRKYKNEARY